METSQAFLAQRHKLSLEAQLLEQQILLGEVEVEKAQALNRPGNRGGCLVKVQRSSARRRGEYGDRVPPPVQEEYTRWTRADADGCTRRPIPTLPIPRQPW